MVKEDMEKEDMEAMIGEKEVEEEDMNQTAKDNMVKARDPMVGSLCQEGTGNFRKKIIKISPTIKEN